MRIMKQKRIRLYLGIDPTGGNLHLGHTIPLRKLQQFADLGHEAILVVGTGTVLAGDPSQRSEARPRITKKEIARHMKGWKKQASKVVDFSKVKIRHNGDWLLKLRLPELLDIAAHLPASHLFQRDMFQKRMARGDAVGMHEVLYPLLQGYDSVVLDVDLEIGGTDQVFNMLVGRELQRKMRDREKYVLCVPMILGLDGKTMSKTSGNTVNITDAPNDMYGKLMTLQDGLVEEYFMLLTDVSLKDIQKMRQKLSPRDFKARLALWLTSKYHGEKKAKKAEEEFLKVFREGLLPSRIPALALPSKAIPLSELLNKTRLASSRSEARRLISQGGVRVDGVRQTKDHMFSPRKGMVLQVGKRKFAKIA